MTISISEQAYNELCQQENVEGPQHPDPDDALDVMIKFPSLLGQGYWREIELRQGLTLEIGDFQLHDHLVTTVPDMEVDWLEYHFHFSGEHQTDQVSLGAGQFFFSGSGVALKTISDALDAQPYLELMIYIKPETLRSFMGNPAGELPPELQPLVRQSNQEQYCRTGTATPAMQTVARRILECPYQGITKRLYLEGKVLELLGLLVAQEIELRDGTIPPHSPKPATLERIHYAREILLQNMEQPPSLSALAQQVKLNEHTLKQGFRQVFGTTVFGYLHDYRMEQARQLLETGEMKVTEVAQAVGFASRNHFAAAFKKKFGTNPKKYLVQRRFYI